MIDTDNTAQVEMPDVMTDRDWLDLSERSYDDSTIYLDSALRKRIERNYAYALSRHPSGSKYYTDSYKHRSKYFRGKTAASIRSNLAAGSVALFSTQDVVSIKAQNDENEKQRNAAKAIDILQNYHFDINLQWYRIFNGAYREAQTNGVVFSKQWWKYETEIMDGEDGPEEVVISDFPVIELIPIENIRISPAADWLDPIGTSPYTILLYPMFVYDVKERMTLDWHAYDDDTISKTISDQVYDSIRRAREGDKPDSKEESVSVKDQDIVWIRENFMRYDGITYQYYSLGKYGLLSEPVPVHKAYPHVKNGRPPVRMGVGEIEAFNIYPQSKVERVEGLQVQSNDIANQRADNIAQNLNTRKLIQRNKNVDYRALMSNIPGQNILTDDIEAIKEMPSKDVTGTAYQEQNVLNMDFDELAGSFSTASVATNRDLGETVGGMQLLSGNSNVITEFDLKTFVESWVEPIHRDVAGMIQTYEDPETIKKITGMDLNHADLNEEVIVKVSVGFGATDPSQKVSKLVYGISAAAKIIPGFTEKLAPEEIAAEIMGALGYKDGKRFVPDLGKGENPQVQQLKKVVEELKDVIEKDKVKVQGDLQLAQMKHQNAMSLEEKKFESDEAERQSRERIAEMDLRKEAARLALQEDTTIKQIMKELQFKKVETQEKQKDRDAQRILKGDDLKGKIYLDEVTGGDGGGFYPG